MLLKLKSLEEAVSKVEDSTRNKDLFKIYKEFEAQCVLKKRIVAIDLLDYCTGTYFWSKKKNSNDIKINDEETVEIVEKVKQAI